jgi:hypothetical protein
MPVTFRNNGLLSRPSFSLAFAGEAARHDVNAASKLVEQIQSLEEALRALSRDPPNVDVAKQRISNVINELRTIAGGLADNAKRTAESANTVITTVSSSTG